MKIGVPTMGDRGMDEVVCDHFGRAPTYTIVDSDTGSVRIIENRSEHMGGTGKPPEALARESVNLLLCSGLGPRAITMFQDSGIAVYVGATGSVREVLSMWREGRLQAATSENACKEHLH
ncbi:MAG TPA: dinitrogenase iron-molybdenum cofactor biosynthesis protein [Euryarchaeota archaeon]|nr:dinitrogenase iron-molybdenum cofactor biosynthesis protein [Euryarchaeota archaeon]